MNSFYKKKKNLCTFSNLLDRGHENIWGGETPFKEHGSSMENLWRMDNQISSLPIERFGNNIMFPILDGLSAIQSLQRNQYIHLSLSKESKCIGFSNVANTTEHYKNQKDCPCTTSISRCRYGAKNVTSRRNKPQKFWLHTAH